VDGTLSTRILEVTSNLHLTYGLNFWAHAHTYMSAGFRQQPELANLFQAQRQTGV